MIEYKCSLFVPDPTRGAGVGILALLVENHPVKSDEDLLKWLSQAELIAALKNRRGVVLIRFSQFRYAESWGPRYLLSLSGKVLGVVNEGRTIEVEGGSVFFDKEEIHFRLISGPEEVEAAVWTRVRPDSYPLKRNQLVFLSEQAPQHGALSLQIATDFLSRL